MKFEDDIAETLLNEAITATREVLADRAAPSTAKASAVSSAIAITKILKEQDAGDKEPSQMTADELKRAIAAATARLEDAGAGFPPLDTNGDLAGEDPDNEDPMA